MNLAYRFPIVFWDCANLIVDSGGKENIDAKGTATNYAKIAVAINKAKSTSGTEVSLVDINSSEFTFTPDVENNRIIFGLSGISGVNKEIIQEIIKNRPYSSLQDFMEKVKCNKTVMVSLIKSGAFDQFGERQDIMREYIWAVCEPKKRITLQNFNMLVEKELIPQELDFQRRLFRYNKALKSKCSIDGKFVMKADNYYKFYEKFFDIDLLEPYGNKLAIDEKTWKKLYENGMAPAKKYFKEHQKELLEKLNQKIFEEVWNKYAAGNYSAWEMSSLNMYYHDHELANINKKMYGLTPYKNLPTEPKIERTFERNGVDIPIYRLQRICGTVIAKDDAHSSFSLLTPESGVVTVKVNRDYFARCNRRISKIQEDGTKKVQEEGWFKSGTLVMAQGVRKGDIFLLKKYKESKHHQLEKITGVQPNGTVKSTWQRYGEEDND